MSEKIPVGMSAGGDNAHCVSCQVIQQQKAYAACLHINARLQDGKLNQELYAECVTAIKRGNCEAADMRQREIEAGESLYYRPMPKSEVPVTKIDKTAASYGLGWNKVKVSAPKTVDLPGVQPFVKKPAAPKSAPKAPPPQPSHNAGDYAQAINKVLADTNKNSTQNTKSSVTENKSQQPKSVMGGSLLDIARRRAAAQQEG